MKFLEDTYLFEIAANVLSQGPDYLVLDHTIFYPQGGGQPCDTGTIDNIIMDNVRIIGDEIRHYGDITGDYLDKRVICRINADKRMMNARYHTAGHLIANIVEDIYPEIIPIKCHAYPKEAYTQYSGNVNVYDISRIQSALDDVIAKDLLTKIFEINKLEFEKKYYKLPYEVPENKGFRVLQIGDYKPVPCGGTHISNTKEIGNVMIKRGKIKDSVLKISYELC